MYSDDRDPFEWRPYPCGYWMGACYDYVTITETSSVGAVATCSRCGGIELLDPTSASS